MALGRVATKVHSQRGLCGAVDMRQDDALGACVKHRTDRTHGRAVHPHPRREATGLCHLAQIGNITQAVHAVFGIDVKTIEASGLEHVHHIDVVAQAQRHQLDCFGSREFLLQGIGHGANSDHHSLITGGA